MYCDQESIISARVKNPLPKDMMLSIDDRVQSYNTCEDTLLYAGNTYKSGQDKAMNLQEFENTLREDFIVQVSWISMRIAYCLRAAITNGATPQAVSQASCYAPTHCIAAPPIA